MGVGNRCREYVDQGYPTQCRTIEHIGSHSQRIEVLIFCINKKRMAQAKVISAKADVESAKLMKEAAAFLDSKAAMQIRYLETISILGK